MTATTARIFAMMSAAEWALYRDLFGIESVPRRYQHRASQPPPCTVEQARAERVDSHAVAGQVRVARQLREAA